MSETPPQQPETGPERTPAQTDPADGPRPFYKRPGPLIGILVLLLILVVILPPIVAQEVPVGLTEEGERNLRAGGWQQDEQESTTRALAGLVLVDPITLTREESGMPTGVYVYTTVKIPAMLPMGVVTDQMHDNALELLAENGVDVHTETADRQDYDGNGHDAQITYYSAIAESDDFFVPETQVDLFIATWRCSILGSYAVTVGAVPDPTGGLLAENGQDLDQVERDLLAHTKCDG